MQTEKDAEIVGWIGRIGAAGAEHVMARFDMGRSWAYARLSRLVRDGLLEQKTLLYRTPGLYVATTEGLRWTFLERLGVYRVAPGGFQHATELIAAMAGTKPAWVTTQQTEQGLIAAGPSGRGTRRRGYEFEIRPSRIKSLGVGEAVVITPGSGPPTIAQIHHPQDARQ